MRIHANFLEYASLNFDASKYISSPAFGVNRFMLDRIGDEKARATSIVQYKPNSKFPEHTHVGGEEFLVLEGTFRDEYGVYPTGTYVRNPIGSKHAPWVDEDGCTIFVKLLQMSEVGDTPTSLYIDTEVKDIPHRQHQYREKQQQLENEQQLNFQEQNDHNGTQQEQLSRKSDRVQKKPYGSVLQLFHNKLSGEIVEIIWLNPNQMLPLDEGQKGGEEIFVIYGSLCINDELQFCYNRWGWLRFPPTIQSCTDEASSSTNLHRLNLMAGKEGAKLYRKTGHLTTKALSMEKIQIL